MAKTLRSVDVASEAVRTDGLINSLTGIGVAGRDKNLGTLWRADTVSLEQLEELYRGDDLAAQIIESVPDDMFRQGLRINIQGDKAKKKEEAVIAYLEEHFLLERLHEALCWARAYGGAGVLLGAEDGQSLERPLNLNEEEDLPEISSFRWMTVLGPRELRPADLQLDLKAPRYGEVEVYEIIQPTTDTQPVGSKAQVRNLGNPRVRVHHSRILRFDGVRISRRMKKNRTENGWGDSVLVRPNQVLRDFHASWRGAGILLTEFSQAIMRIKGLAELLAEEDGTRKLVERARAVQLARSVAGMVIMDSEEEFARVATSVAGLPEMLQQFAIRIAAAARIPVTRLFGQSPSGLNATGESDIRNYYDRVQAEQTKTLRPALEKIIKLVFLAKNGPTQGKEPPNWSVEFPPQWKMTEDQESTVRNRQAATDKMYIDAGVLLPEEVAVSRFGGDAWSMDTKLSEDRDENGVLAAGSDLEPEPEPEPQPPGGPAPTQKEPPGSETPEPR